MLGSACVTSPRFDAKAAGAAIVAIAIALAIVLVVQAGAATAAPNNVVISTKAPVKPAQFKGDVRKLKRPTPFPRRPTVEPGEHEDVEKKTGAPAASPIPKATTAMPATIVNFAGLDFANWGAGWPPDTVGDVGPNHYIQAVNTSIGICGKTGGAPLAAFTFNTLCVGNRHPVRHEQQRRPDGDLRPDGRALDRRRLRLDEHRERAATTSASPSPRPATPSPAAGGYTPTGRRRRHPWLPDYPKMGMWPDGLYMTTNMFDCLDATCSVPATRNARVYAFDRADMYAGAPLSSIVVDLNSRTTSACCPATYGALPLPLGARIFVIAESTTVFEFEVWKFHVDWVTPATRRSPARRSSITRRTTFPCPCRSPE